jgi:hypothetical protein
MIGCLGESRATQQSDLVAGAVAALAAAVIVVRSHWLAALSVETLILLLAAGWGTWQAWLRAARGPRTSSAPRALPGWPANRVDQDRPLRPVR